MKLEAMIFDALVRRHLDAVAPLTDAPAPEGVKFIKGPYWSNRSMRRARGERLYKFGLGAMATSLKTKRVKG